MMYMKKTYVLVLTVITAILVTAGLTFLNARYINPTDYKVHYLKTENPRIPSSFDGFSIMFFSDLEFGSYFNKERLEQFIAQVNELNADLVIFGGDLFDKNYSPVSSEVTKLIEAFKSIKADKGKFYIMGDFDQTSEQRAALVNRIMFEADFESLNNNPILIHNDSSEFFNLIGLNYVDYQPDLNEAFSNLSSSSYTLSIVHGASFAELLPLNVSDLTISGHSHHMQIDFPFFVSYSDYPATGKYGTGKFKLTNTELYVSSGVGTTQQDLRLFSDPEILIIQMKK